LSHYFCDKCGMDLEEKDLREGIRIGKYIMLLCPCCSEWITIEKTEEKNE